jgi:biotin/methionine sulfoxide reductase
VKFINVSPMKNDAPDFLHAEWLSLRPGSDAALMLGLAHCLLSDGQADRDFLCRYTVGFDRVEHYLSGKDDGQVKDAAWAANRTGINELRIRALARQMAGKRTMLTTAAGVQRADFGEQPLWMTVTLAAMLGQIGLAGGGFGLGYAVNGNIGSVDRPYRWSTLL